VVKVVTINSLEQLNKIIESRGLSVLKVEHSDEKVTKSILDGVSFGIEYDDEDPVKDYVGSEKKVCEWHYLNWLLASRGVGLTRINLEDKQLFSSFIPQFLHKLKFTVDVKGVFVPPWDVRQNNLITNKLMSHPFVNKRRSGYV